jgi:hypothetical protein
MPFNLRWFASLGPLSFVIVRDDVDSFEAPVVDHPPGYRSSFCRHCGSPMPVVGPGDDWFEIAAGGVLDDAPGLFPDRHIFIDFKAPWHHITDGLEQLTKRELIGMRVAEMKRREGRQ